MKRAKVIVKGEVQTVGFRGFVIGQMKSLNLNGYADNLPDGTVEILCEGEKNRIDELIEKIRDAPPHFAKVESAEPQWQKYIGDLKEPERRGEDIPKEGATLDDLLVVLKSFDKKAEVLNERVGDVASNTKSIISNTGDMATTLREFRKESGEKQDQMLDKQDQTIGAIDKLDVNVNRRFDHLDIKYGKIAEHMEKILEEMKEERKEARKSMERILNAILKLAEKSAE
jgi:acylphosphatase